MPPTPAPTMLPQPVALSPSVAFHSFLPSLQYILETAAMNPFASPLSMSLPSAAAAAAAGIRPMDLDPSLYPSDLMSASMPFSPTATTPTSGSTATFSSQRALARKQAAAEKVRRKQREREAALEADRARVEAERAHEAAKRAERRQREANLPLPCCLCTVRGGALKPTDEFDVDIDGYLQYQSTLSSSTPRSSFAPPQRLWAHIVCALWLPRTTVDDVSTMQEIKGVKDAWKFRLFKHGLPPAALTATQPTSASGTNSSSQVGGLALSSSPSLSPSTDAFSTNAFALHSLSNLHMLSNMNPLNLMSNLNHAAPPPQQQSQSVSSSTAAPESQTLISSAAGATGGQSASNFSQSAPFLLPLPPLPLSVPSPSHGAGGGLSGIHAAQAINTMMNLQVQQQTGASSSSSPPPPAGSQGALMMRSMSLPVPATTSSRGGQQNGVCGLCKKAYGCCVYCSADLCSHSYHPLCAWYAGLYMRTETGGASTDIRYYLYCSMHTPLEALAIEIVEDTKSDATMSHNNTASGAETTRNAQEEVAEPAEKKQKKVHFEESSEASPVSSPIPPAAPPRDPTYFPWVTLHLDPSSATSVSAFISLFSSRNKLRLLQQREYRNRGRQEQTKKAKMQRKKRRIRLYGQTQSSALEGTSLGRRRHVRTAADGTPIFDRSTRGESKAHSSAKEDQYELGRCAVCFQTDEEIRSKSRWEAQKVQREWIDACKEAFALGYAPPPKPAPPALLQPMQPSSRKRSNGSTGSSTSPIPPHVAAFFESDPLLRCCECEVEVHAKCLSRDHEVLVLGAGWVPLPQVRVGDRVWSIQRFGSEQADWSQVIRAPIKYVLAQGENMVHIQTSQLNLLTTTDHNNWVRKPNGEWTQELTEQLGEQRQFLTGAVSTAAAHMWSESFLPSTINNDAVQQIAWCALLGFMLGVATISGDRSSGVVQLDCSQQPAILAWLQQQLASLGWHQAQPTSDRPYFSLDAARQCYTSDCSALVDFVVAQQHRLHTCPHDWRFHLSATQARAALWGHAVATGGMESSYSEQEQQDRVDSGLQKEVQPLRAFTSSIHLRDDLMLIAARAGWPASFSLQRGSTVAAVGESWLLEYHEFYEPHSANWLSAKYTTVSRKPLDSAAAAPSSYQSVHTEDREAWCIEVSTGNFLTRRNAQPTSDAQGAGCHMVFTGNCYGVQYEEVQAQLQAQERRKLKLQRVVKMGGGAGSSASSSFIPFSALSMQQELDELHQQWEDELAEELEEEEENNTQWKCRRCVEKEKDISCVLCFRKGGAFKVSMPHNTRTLWSALFSSTFSSSVRTSFHADSEAPLSNVRVTSHWMQRRLMNKSVHKLCKIQHRLLSFSFSPSSFLLTRLLVARSFSRCLACV